MTKIRFSRARAGTALAAVALSCTFNAHAAPVATDTTNTSDAAPATPSADPVTPSESGQPLWEAGVGGIAIQTPVYPGADQTTTRALGIPFLLYRGKILRIDQQGVGARLVNNDRVTFDIGFSASLPAHSKDVEARRGMPDLGGLFEFGPRVKLRLFDLGENASAGRVRLELPVRAVIEARSGVRRQGWTSEPRLVWEQRGAADRWTVEAQVGALYGDRRIHRYFYDVDPQYATATRPEYHAGPGLLLVRTGLFGTWRAGRDWRLFGFVRYDSYADSASRDSPLFKKNAGVSAGFGFAWTFARSSARASE